jgi:hypothetical protein
MFKRFKNIKLWVIVAHLIVTLAYPAIKASISEYNRLLIFNDALTIVGLILIVIGLFYSFVLHGDFDRTKYVFMRGLNRESSPYGKYSQDSERKREDSFNYPLFLGIIYVAVSLIIAYAIL